MPRMEVPNWRITGIISKSAASGKLSKIFLELMFSKAVFGALEASESIIETSTDFSTCLSSKRYPIPSPKFTIKVELLFLASAHCCFPSTISQERILDIVSRGSKVVALQKVWGPDAAALRKFLFHKSDVLEAEVPWPSPPPLAHAYSCVTVMSQ